MLIKIYLLIVYMLRKLRSTVGSTDDGIVAYLRRGREGVTINNDSFLPPTPLSVQADVCHAYQILHAHGVPDDHIVVMMYDDIANNEE